MPSATGPRKTGEQIDSRDDLPETMVSKTLWGKLIEREGELQAILYANAGWGVRTIFSSGGTSAKNASNSSASSVSSSSSFSAIAASLSR